MKPKKVKTQPSVILEHSIIFYHHENPHSPSIAVYSCLADNLFTVPLIEQLKLQKSNFLYHNLSRPALAPTLGPIQLCLCPKLRQ